MPPATVDPALADAAAVAASRPAPPALSRGPLRFEFDAREPLLRRITCADAALDNPAVTAPRVQVVRLGLETLWSGPAAPELVLRCHRIDGDDAAPDTLRYGCEVTWSGDPAAAFTVRFELDAHGRLVATLAEVVEHEGFHLLAVSLQQFLAVGSRVRTGRLLVPHRGGRVVDPATASKGRKEHWPGFDYHYPGGAIYHDRLLALLTVPSVDDTLYFTVGEATQTQAAAALSAVDSQIMGWECEPDAPTTPTPGAHRSRYAGIEVLWRYRAPSPRPELRFVAPHEPRCVVEVVAPQPGRSIDWLDAARAVRRRCRARPCDDYDATLLPRFSIQRNDRGYARTFSDAWDWIRSFHHLTDDRPQIAFVVGFQHEGHDTGYPDILTGNAQAGGMARLQQLFRDAQRLNVQISFHDNVQACYRSSPRWDPALPARDAHGGLLKGAVWSAGQVYLMGQARYADHIERRLDETLATYPMLHRSIYWDAMTTYLGRYDFTPGRPAGLEQELDGKKRMVAAARRRGLEVISETFSPYLVDELSHTLRLHDEPTPLFDPSEQRVPFTHAAFHGRATWGSKEVLPTDPDECRRRTLHLLAGGSGFTAAIAPDKPLAAAVTGTCLVELPRQLLRRHVVADWTRDGAREHITYALESGDATDHCSGDTFVEIDHEAVRYRVVVAGQLVAHDFTTLVPHPRDPSRCLGFSLTQRECRYPLPRHWSPSDRVSAALLTKEGPGPAVPCHVEGRELIWHAPAASPVTIWAQPAPESRAATTQ